MCQSSDSWRLNLSASQARVNPLQHRVNQPETVSLLRWRSGGVEHPHDTPPYPFMPSPTFGLSSCSAMGALSSTYFARQHHLRRLLFSVTAFPYALWTRHISFPLSAQG